MPRPVAIAIGAHPDDIEFGMAGTLRLLAETGYETHYLNLASGNCGSAEHNARQTRAIRGREARKAAEILGAHFHPCLTDDLEIVYSVKLLRTLAAILREVKPAVVLTHSPQDYMEDHMSTCRLAVTAAFAHGMPNFKTVPVRPATSQEIALYHAMPHGLRDGLGRRIIPGAFVNTSSVQSIKRDALAAHRSQQPWLDTSQGLNSYLLAMEEMSLKLGRGSRRFKFAEGWRRHWHLGLCAPAADPLRDALGRNYLINRAHQRNLDKGI
jgi:LmbE family N-acetylglucosaminyl deacetylase